MTLAQRTAGMRIVMGMFEVAPRDWERWDRRRRRTRRFGLGAVLVSTLGLLALAVGALFVAVWTGDWAAYWDKLDGIPQLLAPLPVVLIFALPYPRYLRSTVQALRDAAARRDDHIAPPASVQPVPLAPSELAAVMETIRPLHGDRDRFRAGQMTAMAIVCTTFGLVFGVLFSLGVAYVQGALPGVHAPEWVVPALIAAGVLIAGLVCLLFGVAVWCAIWAPQLRRGLSVTVDQWGLRWRDTRWRTGEHSVQWNEIRSFVTTARPVPGGYSRLFCLDAVTGESLVWVASDLGPDHIAQASGRLCRLVVTRTGLAVRDLTPAAAALGAALQPRQSNRHAQSEVPQYMIAPDVLEAIERHQKRARRLATWILVGTLALLVALYPGAWALEHLQAGTHHAGTTADVIPHRPALFEPIS
ncbi:MAG TPA: hypothetical protein VFU88_00180 [Ktedonobacterales bacterium]|nr:hypothetical protein [Ktedonobacterales bacterium]